MSSRLLRVPQCLSLLFSSSGNPNPDPSPNSYPKRLETTINSLFQVRNPDKLVAPFNKSIESYCFLCKHRICEIAVHRLVAAGLPDAIEAILEEQKRFPADIAREGFAVRLISLHGAGMPSAGIPAAVTFHQLPALGCPSSIMFFNALLSACADAGDSDWMAAAFRGILPPTPPSSPISSPTTSSFESSVRRAILMRPSMY